MIELDIPGFGPLALAHLVLDMNGTLTVAGEWIEGVRERLIALSPQLDLHVLTADTYGRAGALCANLPVAVTIIEAGQEALAKRDYVVALGAQQTAAMGNGRNDARMLAEARLGIAVMEAEGCAAQAAAAATILCRGAVEALDLLLHPQRLRATLRA